MTKDYTYIGQHNKKHHPVVGPPTIVYIKHRKIKCSQRSWVERTTISRLVLFECIIPFILNNRPTLETKRERIREKKTVHLTSEEWKWSTKEGVGSGLWEGTSVTFPKHHMTGEHPDTLHCPRNVGGSLTPLYE